MNYIRTSGRSTFAETALAGLAAAGRFSGLYTHDVLTWGGASFARICAEAHAEHLLCAPSVGPGDDAASTTGNPVVKPRRDGLTYDTLWRDAIRAGADEVTITSFNEWEEGKQIEPALSPPRFGVVRDDAWSYDSYDGAWGLTDAAAENAYLTRTAYWAAIFPASRPPPRAGRGSVTTSP